MNYNFTVLLDRMTFMSIWQ